MYKKFYSLQRNPFSLTPDPQFVCMTGQHREALSGLIYSVCTNAGLTLLVGEVGTGKTTLLYTLLNFLEKRKYVTGICSNPLLTSEEFYDYLLSVLDVPCASSLKSQRLIALQETLLRNRAAGRPSVLIVDEAQKLSTELLEEIRLLTNLETPREKLLQIIIAGQPELFEIFRRPELRQLKQRLNYICKLQPLSIDEIREYLHHRLACAGLPQQTLFSASAIETIYECTKGIPRLINTLCDNALRTGFALQSPHITVSIIQEAAGDLDLLPHPVRGNSPPESERRLPRATGFAAPKTLAPPAPVLVPDFRPEANGKQPIRIPLESYASRQKSLGFLAGLLDRLR